MHCWTTQTKLAKQLHYINKTNTIQTLQVVLKLNFKLNIHKTKLLLDPMFCFFGRRNIWSIKCFHFHLHWFQSCQPGGDTCRCNKFGHQVASHALSVLTLPWISLLALSVSIELVSSSAWVTSVKGQQGIVSDSTLLCYISLVGQLTKSVSEFQRLGPIDWTPGIPGSDN